MVSTMRRGRIEETRWEIGVLERHGSCLVYHVNTLSITSNRRTMALLSSFSAFSLAGCASCIHGPVMKHHRGLSTALFLGSEHGEANRVDILRHHR